MVNAKEIGETQTYKDTNHIGNGNDFTGQSSTERSYLTDIRAQRFGNDQHLFG